MVNHRPFALRKPHFTDMEAMSKRSFEDVAESLGNSRPTYGFGLRQGLAKDFSTRHPHRIHVEGGGIRPVSMARFPNWEMEGARVEN
jgi:hypothetical protein